MHSGALLLGHRTGVRAVALQNCRPRRRRVALGGRRFAMAVDRIISAGPVPVASEWRAH